MAVKKSAKRGGKAKKVAGINSTIDDFSPRKNISKTYTKRRTLSPLAIALIIALAVIVVFALVYILSYDTSLPLTGKTVYSDVDVMYSPGEMVSGNILFNLKAGELMPRDTLVTISLGDSQQEFVLGDYVDQYVTSGEYYTEGADLVGEGEGFGVIGEMRTYPEVEFELEIIYEEDESSSEEPVVEEPSMEEPVTEETEGGLAEEPADEPASDDVADEAVSDESESGEVDVGGNEEGETIITGEVVSEGSRTVSGSVSAENEFTYSLADGESARLVSGSVTVDGEAVSDSVVSVNEEEGQVVVTTDHYVSEECFGEACLGGENELTFMLDLEDLEFAAQEGVLSIQLSHDGETIASYQEVLSVAEEDVASNVVQIAEIPMMRVPVGGVETVDMSQYFDGAERYELEAQGVTADVDEDVMTLVAGENKGVRKAKIIAYGEGDVGVESNEFTILVGSVSVRTVRSQVKVGEPVRWEKTIESDEDGETVVEIPSAATEVSVEQVEEGDAPVLNSPITGEVTVEVKLKKTTPSYTKNENPFLKWVEMRLRKAKVTGQVTNQVALPEVEEITVDGDATVVYYTPGPESTEEMTASGKRITISADDSLGYEDILAFTELDNTISVDDSDKIKLYWVTTPEEVEAVGEEALAVTPADLVEEVVVEETITGNAVLNSESAGETVKTEVPVDCYDLDGDDFIDYCEWVVPHLSDQVYELIIEIYSAEHLDASRVFVEDVYAEVYSQDGVWKEIPAGDYVRVTFEQALTDENDITLYARSSVAGASVRVYEMDGTSVIAQFGEISGEGIYKIYLTSLSGTQDTFDLEVTGGAVEFDWIVDPTDGAPEISFTAATSADGSTVRDGVNVGLSTSDMSNHYSFVDFDRDVLAWYRMDDLIGFEGNTVDSSSYNNTLQGSVAVVNQTTGAFGDALVFDNNNGYLTAFTTADVLGFNKDGEMSISLWANIESGYGSMPLVFKDDHEGDVQVGCQFGFGGNPKVCGGYILMKDASGVIKFGAHNGTNVNVTRQLVSSSAVPEDTWVHIVLTYTNSSTMIYVNGTLSGSGNGTLMSAPNSAYYIYLGRTPANDPYEGMLDELVYFNRSLTAAEVRALYDSSSYSYSRNFTNLDDGVYNFTGYAVDSQGNVNQTSSRSVTVNSSLTDTTPPAIAFDASTPSDGSTLDSSAIYVGLDTSDSESDHYAFADFGNDLRVWMRMDDVDESGNPTDISVWENNGAKDGANQTANGKFGEGFAFDGNGDSVSISDSESTHFDSGLNYTWSLWAKPAKFSSEMALFSKGSMNGDNTVNGYFFFLNSAGRVCAFEGSQSGIVCTGASGNVSLNEWSHIVITYNGKGDGGSTKEVNVYVDGVFKNNIVESDPVETEWLDSSSTLYLGYYPTDGIYSDSYFNGTLDEFIMFDRILNDSEILSLYDAATTQYAHNFTGLDDGVYNFTGYAVDAAGNRNQTALRTVTLQTHPNIDFAQPTLNAGALSEGGTISVNVEVTNAADEDSIVFSLYGSGSVLLNESRFTSAVRSLNFTGLDAGSYSYSVFVNDTSGKNESTGARTITLLPSCFDANVCAEGGACVLNATCVLHTSLCSGTTCDFANLTVNTTVYTLYESNGDGRDLAINMTSETPRSPITFLVGGSIVFSGRAGSDLGAGSAGGDGGVVNITVPKLFNTTGANFTGVGGFTTESNPTPGGDGGTLQLNFWGLIQNFTSPTPRPNVAPGASVGPVPVYGANGKIIYNRNLEKLPRDVDVTGDGEVDAEDYQTLEFYYGVKNADETYREMYDVTGNGKLDVIDISKVGFEFRTR